MLKNHINLFLRHIRRHKSYAFINISGLAIGMSSCILILLFIQKELSFESMHANVDRTYRVLTIDKALGTNNQRVGITYPALGPALPEAFSEIEDASRLTFGGQTLLKFRDNPAIYAEQLRNADPNFFEFFDFELIQGDSKTALVAPFSIVLTETLSKRLFMDQDPLGQIVTDGSGDDFTITGILEDLPDNTHLQFDALGSITTLASQARANQPPDSQNPIWLESFNGVRMPTYARLAPGVNLLGFDERVTEMTRDNGVPENFDITFQPLNDVHLGSTDVIFDPVTNKGDRSNIYVFGAIAILILLIAIVNYTNLATARSTDRAREVGLRKVVGCQRSQIIGQFLTESLLTTCFALALSLVLTWLALPFLSDLSGMNLEISATNLPEIGFFLVFMLVVVGLLAGLYPAIALSGFEPITVLKGSFASGKKGRALRVGLVVFQFTISIAMIASTAMVQKQLNYIQTRDMGYDREQVLLLDMVDNSMSAELNNLRETLEGHSSFAAVGTSGNVPGRTFGRTRVRPEGMPEDDIWIWSVFSVSPETLPTLGMEMAEGRNFSREMGTDSSGVVIINETAVSQLGWDNPLERRLYQGPQDSTGLQIIGVVTDFHWTGIHQNIEPVMITPLNTNPGNVLAARIRKGQIQQALAFAEETWNTIYPEYPFSYSFMDTEFDTLYSRDLSTGRIVNLFSSLAILIACLGLFGLASYTTLQRTKEIGVRKIMGASTNRIVSLLVIDFVRWVVLANILAWPLAWYASSRWLGGFAYRIEIDPLVFLGASLIAIVISVLTVLGQSLRAAHLNPAHALRYE